MAVTDATSWLRERDRNCRKFSVVCLLIGMTSCSLRPYTTLPETVSSAPSRGASGENRAAASTRASEPTAPPTHAMSDATLVAAELESGNLWVGPLPGSSSPLLKQLAMGSGRPFLVGVCWNRCNGCQSSNFDLWIEGERHARASPLDVAFQTEDRSCGAALVAVGGDQVFARVTRWTGNETLRTEVPAPFGGENAEKLFRTAGAALMVVPVAWETGALLSECGSYGDLLNNPTTGGLGPPVEDFLVLYCSNEPSGELEDTQVVVESASQQFNVSFEPSKAQTIGANCRGGLIHYDSCDELKITAKEAGRVVSTRVIKFSCRPEPSD